MRAKAATTSPAPSPHPVPAGEQQSDYRPDQWPQSAMETGWPGRRTRAARLSQGDEAAEKEDCQGRLLPGTGKAGIAAVKVPRAAEKHRKRGRKAPSGRRMVDRGDEVARERSSKAAEGRWATGAPVGSI